MGKGLSRLAFYSATRLDVWRGLGLNVAMLIEDKKMLWRLSAAAYGMALPMVLVGRSLMFGLLAIGLIAGLMATKGESLRATVRVFMNSWLVVAVVGLLVVWMAGVLVAPAMMEAFDKWLQMLVVALIAALVYMSLREMPGAYVETMMKALAISTVAMIGLALTDTLLDYRRLSDALHGDKGWSNYRLNFFSGALVVIVPFIWARLMIKAREGEPFAQRVAGPVIGLTLAAIVACGGRAGWVGLAVALPVFVFLAARYHGAVMHARQWLLGLLALGAGVGIYVIGHGWDFVASRINPAIEAGVGRGVGSGRIEVWNAVVQQIELLTGAHALVGVGLMGYRYLPGAIDLHPHNWLLQVVLETGALGTLGFMGLIGLIAYSFFTYARGNLYGVAALTSLVAFLVTGLFSTSIFNAWWVTFLVMSTLIGWRVGWAGTPSDGNSRRKVRSARVLSRADLTSPVAAPARGKKA